MSDTSWKAANQALRILSTPPGLAHTASHRPSLLGCPISTCDSIEGPEKYILTKKKKKKDNRAR